MALWCMLFFLLNFCCLSVEAKNNCTNHEAEFDYLLLSQFWPYASVVFYKNEGLPWRVPITVKGFTIHGLWPSIPGTEGPCYCNDSMKFDFNKIEALDKSLEANWPFYGLDQEKTTLWEHEWTKHGTCAYSLPDLKGEKRYFSKTLNLHAKLKTKELLAQAKIFPSETRQYSLKYIFSEVKKSYGTMPVITCILEKKTNEYHLEQIWLCYTKSFEPLDCPAVDSTRRGSSTLYFESLKEKASTIPANKGHFQFCPPHGKVFYKPIPRSKN